jgi:hypothetical protein
LILDDPSPLQEGHWQRKFDYSNKMKSSLLPLVLAVAVATQGRGESEHADRAADESIASRLSVEGREKGRRDVVLGSALAAAQKLEAPQSAALYGGEDENSAWWDAHEGLLRQARHEWGRKHPDLYEWTRAFRESYVDPQLLRAFEERNLTLFHELVRPTTVDNVFTVPLFRSDYAETLLDELHHQEASGIPLRRPNGMNRYGTILSELGFESSMRGLVEDILAPLALSLFPRHVGPADITNNYPFTVRYRPDQDVELSEHADASVVTVNVCLEPDPSLRYVLYFKRHRSLKPLPWTGGGSGGNGGDAVTFLELSQPGQAVVHLGQIVHGVAPVSGRRSNLVLWLFGEHGDVRVAEYDEDETWTHEHESAAFWSDDAARSTSTLGEKRDDEL